MKNIIIGFIGLASLLVVPQSHAGTITVPKDYPTIQVAIDGGVETNFSFHAGLNEVHLKGDAGVPGSKININYCHH